MAAYAKSPSLRTVFSMDTTPTPEEHDGAEPFHEKEDVAEKAKREKKKPLFVYPALPKMEVGLYFTIMISVFSYLVYLVFKATQEYDYANRKGSSSRMRSWLPYFGEVQKDVSNWEWLYMVPFFKKILPVFIGHSLVLNVSGYFFAKDKPRLWEACRLSFALAATIFVFRVRVVSLSLLCGLIMYSSRWFTKRGIFVWLTAAPLLYINLEYTAVLSGFRVTFLPLLFISYKILSFIGYCSEFERGERRGWREFLWGYWDMLVFANYLPYSLSVICIYKSYKRQIAEREFRSRNWGGIVFFALRLLFWTALAELVLHFFHFELLLSDKPYIRTISLTELCGLGYMVGQFFHLKYVVIFGLPNLFARIDNMQPLPGPICVPRLSLYSHMWRGFDRGLYMFFKEYIFLPICRPSFTTLRKIVGMLTSFGFVLLWHGFRHHYIVWIILNICELATEQIAKAIYSIPTIRGFREKYVSDTMFRRIIAVLCLLPYSFSFYSTYYFLTDSVIGGTIVQRMFWDNTVPMTPYYRFVWFFCYVHAQCCMSCDRWNSEAEARELEAETKRKLLQQQEEEKKTE